MAKRVASTSAVLSSISEKTGPDAELHSAIVDRVSRTSRDGSASNHYGILRRATAILQKGNGNFATNAATAGFRRRRRRCQGHALALHRRQSEGSQCVPFADQLGPAGPAGQVADMLWSFAQFSLTDELLKMHGRFVRVLDTERTPKT